MTYQFPRARAADVHLLARNAAQPRNSIAQCVFPALQKTKLSHCLLFEIALLKSFNVHIGVPCNSGVRFDHESVL